ncbi:hypothetical protein [Candidatus Methanomassiliicoccus intestinalis]|uniref:Uncharacterized protein n=1 Tax=Methanomassiliicoccus intestinalis (strain Issoire-Mx1) TaxID=1295009 RepID=U5Q1Y3_METII|nr:hypothetical protein [Candidatus Methanomassiliicoccus intestinalis]AGY50176.1 hypothetical protein MMINT_08980 [Candidatus Methanomassiliicoccus intestinalis Issoire-Mx1]
MQTEVAQAAYDACFNAGLFSNYSEIAFIVFMLAVTVAGIWQARTMVKNF